jgi:hypothetical protein
VQEPPSERPDPRLPAVHPIALALAGMPGVVERLLADHYEDPQWGDPVGAADGGLGHGRFNRR